VLYGNTLLCLVSLLLKQVLAQEGAELLLKAVEGGFGIMENHFVIAVKQVSGRKRFYTVLFYEFTVGVYQMHPGNIFLNQENVSFQ
jgi:hypothetical protein